MMTKNTSNFNHFIVLWLGSFINAIGTGLTTFGLTVYVFEQTQSTFLTGLVAIVGLLPRVLLLPYAGVLADRFDRRILMVVGDGISAFGTGLILANFLWWGQNLWLTFIGLTISATFATLTQPAFKATISDLVTEEELVRAGGMVQLNDLVGYLICPLLAMWLIQLTGITWLFVIDILTILVTVSCSFYIRQLLPRFASPYHDQSSWVIFKEGYHYLKGHSQVVYLIFYMSLMTFFLGVVQILITPLILSLGNRQDLGFIMTIAAMGMVVGISYLSIRPIKKGFIEVIKVSLATTGVFMMLTGLARPLSLVTLGGFGIFFSLAFTNVALDYLLRTSVENAYLGRVMGFAGNISQFAFIASYFLTGLLADYVFKPLFSLSNSFGKILQLVWGNNSASGIACLITVAGCLVILFALGFNAHQQMSVKKEE